MLRLFLLPLFCVFFISLSPALHATEARIVVSGSSTVSNLAFAEGLLDLYQRTGFEFDVITSSSGRGVLALVEGKADIAIISADFYDIVEKLNKADGVDIHAEDYDLYKIDETKVLFIVHPDNPMTQITKAQAKDLFTGAVLDWDNVGVPELGPIKIVTEHPTGGIYTTVLNTVTDKEAITDDKISMQNGPQTAIVVSQLPNAFGMLSHTTPQEQRLKVKVLKTLDFESIQRMYFVTKTGENRPRVLKIINVVQEEFSN